MRKHLLYLLFLIIIISGLLSAQEASKIYYTQYHEYQNKVYQADLDGSNEIALDMPIRPKSIAVDWLSSPQKLYIGLVPPSGASKIIRCNIDGSEQEDVITEISKVNDIELDLMARKIYWAQNTYDDDKIFKANMDSLNSSIQVIFSDTLPGKELWGFALDVLNQTIWFTQRGGTSYSSFIKRMSTSGSALTIIMNPVSNPHDIEYYDGKIYWGDNNGLNKANLDGTNKTVIVEGAKIDGLAIDAYNQKIYWVDYSSYYVKYANLDGSGVAVHPNYHSLLSMIDTDYNPSAVTNVTESFTEPDDFVLFDNYPNPFNPSTSISWQSPVGSWQTLKVYDVLGNEIATLVDEYKPAGAYEVEFNIGQESFPVLTSGVYFYQLKAGSFIETKKMLLIK
ncbi:MAG TPA: T9SS type A sorting domain-containing protein [Ignavibacteriaceae bacterium]|nr:T9SS type A sorting domain-containing protein [Ignavibacteriaceae bacterium]